MKQYLRMTALILSAVLAVFLFLTPGMAAAGSPLYSAGSLFTDRDLKQEADLVYEGRNWHYCLYQLK